MSIQLGLAAVIGFGLGVVLTTALSIGLFFLWGQLVRVHQAQQQHNLTVTRGAGRKAAI